MSENQNDSIWTRLLLYLIVIDLLVIIIAIGGRMLLDWQPLTAFYPFFYGAQLGLALAILALLQLLFGLIKKRRAHMTAGASTLVLALLPLGCALLVVGISGFKAPMIHDISTDMQDPPVFSIISSLRTAEENSLEYAGESIAAEQRRVFPDIQPLFSKMDAQAAQNRAQRTLESLGWVIVLNDESTGHLEAYDQSRVFGFIDDVVIRITATDAGSRIDMRSVSRVGLGDLGANASRIRRFFQEFAQ